MFKGGTSLAFAHQGKLAMPNLSVLTARQLPGFAPGKQGWASLSDVRPSLPAFQYGAAVR
jgi:hypothetical protein